MQTTIHGLKLCRLTLQPEDIKLNAEAANEGLNGADCS